MKKICFLFIFLFIPIIVHGEELNLAENAKSAIMIEASTGEILYSKNPNEKYNEFNNNYGKYREW